VFGEPARKVFTGFPQEIPPVVLWQLHSRSDEHPGMAAIRLASSADLAALLDLFDHEKVIEKGLPTVLNVGWALLRIRDTSKYRAAGYDSFEQYCRRRWGWGRNHSRRLMAAVETAALMPPEAGIPRPQTEAQLRPLTPLRHRPDLVQAAWAQAVEVADGDQPTPTEVSIAVQQLRRRLPVQRR
jgi:hypothetical protein